MVYEDQDGLLDLPLPKLIGRHQIENAGVAIAALAPCQASGWGQDAAIEKGLSTVDWPARLQRLTHGPLVEAAPKGAEVWLDGGHNPHGAEAVSPRHRRHGRAWRAAALSDLRHAGEQGRAEFPARLRRPGAPCGDGGDPGRGGQPGRRRAVRYRARAPAWMRRRPKTWMTPCCRSTPGRGWTATKPPPRILICGSLYLAGVVLRENG